MFPQENRSFDNLLGWLKSDANSKIEGVVDGMSTPRNPNDLSEGFVPLTRNGFDISPDDPRHDFGNISVQINNNNMNGFVFDSIVNNITEFNPVSMFDMTSAPIINALALEYALFDHWYCSVPGPTDPNREFAMSGTSQGILTNFNGTLLSQQSYFDYLRTHNRTFAGYFQEDVWTMGYFRDFFKPENSVNIHELEPNFFDDLKSGNIADFVWLQPRGSVINGHLPTWQHPDAAVSEGERLIKEIYEAIRASSIWNETLFLITYDEHGGFYDHVTPPYAGVPSPDGSVASNGYTFESLGVRVPTIAISPWINKGTVISEALPNEQPTPTSQYESTSIMATTNILLGLQDVAPLGNRMAWSNTFAGIVNDRSTPRTDCPLTLPDVPAADPTMYAIQRSKPLNEHLESQLLYYCAMNFPNEHHQGACPGRPGVLLNQGLASDWLQLQKKSLLKRVRDAEVTAGLRSA